MQDRPTAAELLDVAREFLENEVMPKLDGRTHFHTRVTVNLLRMLGREWEQEEGTVRTEWVRLASLLGRDGQPPSTLASVRDAVRAMNAELSSRIRDGALDDRWDEVIAVVRANVADKLAIANPRYADSSE